MERAHSPSPEFDRGLRTLLLRLARETLEAVVEGDPPPVFALDDLPPAAREPRGCFVTLSEHSKLRGCIGTIYPTQPLARAVVENAERASLRDPRFSPVRPEETHGIELEISILTPPRAMIFHSPEELVSQLRPHRHGVILDIGAHKATFLPQVWANLPEAIGFLDALVKKAGCSPGDWRKPETRVSVYEAEWFAESEPFRKQRS